MRLKEIEIHVYGRVQGVLFRATIQREALKRNINGFVMNRADGSVEIVAQAGKKSLESFLQWIQESPGFSSVKGLSYHWRKIGENFKTFAVIKDKPFFADQARGFFNLGRSLLAPSGKIPLHIAIIPDGNRRWAKKKGRRPEFGHYTAASFQHIHELFEEARRLGVKYLTLWGFSTENWKRDSRETRAIFDLLLQNIERFKEEAERQHIRFKHIGRKDRLPKDLVKTLSDLEKETEHYTEFNVQLCLDYGGRDEIIRAVNGVIKKRVKKVNEKDFMSYLDSADIPDIDLIIRTSGEQRLSGFMPFQSAYAELYFCDVHFPDFTPRELRKAVEEYGRRKRTFGGGVR
ncbi:di-trans,poly-cis-decaprenylcistransferase [Candidatus Pacearchaeota archaeon]|nr:di-trans,poly-cis-decaprenylcistransferase [Candidatus Pacearchaeota archaeon]